MAFEVLEAWTSTSSSLDHVTGPSLPPTLNVRYTNTMVVVSPHALYFRGDANLCSAEEVDGKLPTRHCETSGI
jgi:hypothetical protein